MTLKSQTAVRLDKQEVSAQQQLLRAEQLSADGCSRKLPNLSLTGVRLLGSSSMPHFYCTFAVLGLSCCPCLSGRAQKVNVLGPSSSNT